MSGSVFGRVPLNETHDIGLPFFGNNYTAK